jgi:hypothetical protein
MKIKFKYNSREYWESRAEKLEKPKWTVGRTDAFSYVEDEKGTYRYIHYVYPPDELKLERIGFRGGPIGALRKAVRYAEGKNGQKL